MAVDERRSKTNPRTLVQMGVVAFVASAIGIALGLAIEWFPVQGSTQAKKIDDLWDLMLVFAVPVFVIVVTIVLFAVKEFRQRPGEEKLDGPNIHGSTKLEIIWTTIPALIIFILVGYSATVLSDIEEAPAKSAGQELKVDVYGEQFAWTFKYKGLDGKPINTTQLYIPNHKSVKFNVHSKDVIHDFWIPAMRMKIDAVPGITTSYRITPIRLGAYPIVCAELCGLGHAVMRQTAHVMEPAAFDAWMKKQSTPAKAAAPAAAGGGAAPATASIDAKKLFTDGNGNSTACGSCHQLADAGTPAGGIGPDLDKVLPGQTAAMIKESIEKPQAKISKGYPPNVMPPNFSQTLKPEELDALVQYLVQSTKK